MGGGHACEVIGLKDLGQLHVVERFPAVATVLRGKLFRLREHHDTLDRVLAFDVAKSNLRFLAHPGSA